MPDPTTTNLQLAQPTRGSDSGTWDVPVNGNSGILDSAFGGVSAISLSSSPVTLTATQAQASVLRFSGTLSGNVAVTITAINKFWIVQNKCTGAFTVTLKTGSGNVIGLPPSTAQVFSDGTDFDFVSLPETGKMDFWYADDLPAWVRACTVQPYLLMYGETFDAGVYPALNEFLGGNTLPDWRGRVPAALDNMGGSAAGRLTSTTMSPNGNTLGATGGSQTVSLTGPQNGPHTHAVTITDSGHQHVLIEKNTDRGFGLSGGASIGLGNTITNVGQTEIATTGITATTVTSGTGAAHGNVQPAMIAGIFVIRT